MRFRTLGPLEVLNDDGEPLSIPPRQKSLLGLLLVNAGSVVSTDVIIDQIWGESPPKSVKSSVGFHVSKLRGALQPGVNPSESLIFTKAPGYGLALGGHSLDSVDFDRLVATASGHLHSNPQEATQILREALMLWRGPALVDFAYEQFAQFEVTRLNEARAAALEMRFDADLECGRHAELVAELQRAVKEQPLREGLWQRLMMALYRTGRQAEALRAFTDLSATLGEELGISASADLVNLEERILLQDPDLDFHEQRPGNLPAPATSFVGRDEDAAVVRELLTNSRFVSIKGIGGVGKTRLAIEVGRTTEADFDSTWFVDLSSVDTDEGVPAAVTTAFGRTESASGTPLEAVVRWIRDRSSLIIFDNCEQVRAGAAEVIAEVLAACPNVKVIATSRQRLGGSAEYVFELAGLEARLIDGGFSDAVQLLIDRSSAAGRTATWTSPQELELATLCRELDGLPLAIELAAARMRTMTVAEIRSQLDQEADILSDTRRPGSERHKTLSNALEWSYRLLEPGPAELLLHLGVFRGGATREAVMALSGLDEFETIVYLDTLVDASLISVRPTRSALRFEMLESVRRFATRKSDSSTLESDRLSHLGFFKDTAVKCRSHFGDEGQAAALAVLQDEFDNMTAALAASRESADVDAELLLVASLGRFWFDAGYMNHGLRELSTTVESVAGASSPEFAKSLEELAQLCAWNGSVELAEAIAERQARAAEEAGLRELRSRVHATNGVVSFIRGDHRRSIDEFNSMLTIEGEEGSESTPFIHASLAFLNLWTGHRGLAESHFDESVRSSGQLGIAEGKAIVLDFGGWRAFYDGDHQAAIAQWAEAETIYEELQQRTWVIDMQQMQAWSHLIEGVPEPEALAAATSEAVERGLAPFVARGHLLEAAAKIPSDPVEAEAGLRIALDEATRAGTLPWKFWTLWYAATLLAGTGRSDDALACRSRAETYAAAVPISMPEPLAAQDEQLMAQLAKQEWTPAGTVDDRDEALVGWLSSGNQ